MLKSKLQTNTHDLPEALSRLESEGHLVRWGDYAPRCILAEPVNTWNGLARELSRVLGGQWWANRSGATWVCGRNATWLLRPDAVDEIATSRAAVVGTVGEGVGWTLGNIARHLIEWTGIRAQRVPETDAALLADTGWGYRMVLPGKYPWLRYYDMSAAYYTLLSKLPSPHLFRHGNPPRLYFGALRTDESLRWHRALELIGQHKGLRNAVVGAAAGSTGRRQYWCHGIKGELRMWPGAWAGVAHLVVRTAWELCALGARETDAVCACVDSVMTTARAAPGVWAAAGIRSGIKGEGAADVCCPAVYRVGDHQTEFYAAGSRYSYRNPGPPIPEVLYSPMWLEAVKEYAVYHPVLRDWQAAVRGRQASEETRPNEERIAVAVGARAWQVARSMGATA